VVPASNSGEGWRLRFDARTRALPPKRPGICFDHSKVDSGAIQRVRDAVANEHHGTKELASAIRAGAERRPEQAFGDYFVGRRASCALGAAYEGIYRLAKDMGGVRPTKDLVDFFDCLEGTVRSCPIEGCKKRLILSAMIVHLNDHHEWSREQIAAWLEQNGEAKPSK